MDNRLKLRSVYKMNIYAVNMVGNCQIARGINGCFIVKPLLS